MSDPECEMTEQGKAAETWDSEQSQAADERMRGIQNTAKQLLSACVGFRAETSS